MYERIWQLWSRKNFSKKRDEYLKLQLQAEIASGLQQLKKLRVRSQQEEQLQHVLLFESKQLASISGVKQQACCLLAAGGSQDPRSPQVQLDLRKPKLKVVL